MAVFSPVNIYICFFSWVKLSSTNMATEAYCVKCRQKRMMKDEKEVTMPGKGGQRRAMTGLCSTCGTKMFRILGKK